MQSDENKYQNHEHENDDDIYQQNVSNIRKFASERIAIWEYKHGPLSYESRDCIVAIVYGAIVSNARDIINISDPHAPLQDEMKIPTACFCEFMLDGEIDSD